LEFFSRVKLEDSGEFRKKLVDFSKLGHFQIELKLFINMLLTSKNIRGHVVFIQKYIPQHFGFNF